MVGYERALRDPCAETLGAVSRRDSILALVGLCAGALACASGGLGKWLLARTEALLCAFLHLEEGSRA
jgi:hypothetical protein